MKKKNILFMLLIYALAFIGMTNIKADNWINPTIVDDSCERVNGVKKAYYYNYGSTAAPTDYINTCDYFGTNYGDKNNCLSTCTSTYCVRVSETCKYTLTNQSTGDVQQVFCLQGDVRLDEDGDYPGQTSIYGPTSGGSTVINKGISCGLVEAYKDPTIRSQLTWNNDGTLNITSIPAATVIAMQKKIWAHQYDGTSCASQEDPEYAIVQIDESEPTTLNVSSSSSSFSYNSRTNNFVAGPIRVRYSTFNGGNVGVNLSLAEAPSGSFISNSADATSGSSTYSAAGQDVYIIVPKNSVNSSFSAKLVAAGSVKTGTKVKFKASFQELEFKNPTSTNQYNQGLGIATLSKVENSVYADKTVEKTFSKAFGSISITKKDSYTGALLAGVKFKIAYCPVGGECSLVEDIYGNILEGEVVTNASGKVSFNNLNYGRYEVTETKTLDGYIISTETKSFEIGANNENITYDWENTQIKLKITKRDFDDKTALEGAKLVLLDKDFKTVEMGWNESLSTVRFPILPGDYYLYELKAPEGYSTLGEKSVMKFNVDANGSVNSIVFGSLDSRTSPKKFTPSTNNKSDYYSLEVNDGDWDEIDVYNKKIVVKISKKSITGEDELPGATIKITSDKEGFETIEFKSTNTPKELELAHLPEGKYYYMEETVAPVGYEPLLTVFKFSVLEDGTPKLVAIGKWDSKKKFVEDKKLTDEYVKFPGTKDKDQSLVTLLNEPVKTILYKKDSNGEKILEGAVFVVKNLVTGKETKITTTKEATKYYFGPGQYSLVETEAPKGYEKNENVYQFEILDSGEIRLLSEVDDNIKVEENTITIYDAIIEPGDTGNSSFLFPVLGALVVLLGGSIVYFAVRKKQLSSF